MYKPQMKPNPQNMINRWIPDILEAFSNESLITTMNQNWTATSFISIAACSIRQSP